jgi:hypothetical protein
MDSYGVRWEIGTELVMQVHGVVALNKVAPTGIDYES